MELCDARKGVSKKVLRPRHKMLSSLKTFMISSLSGNIKYSLNANTLSSFRLITSFSSNGCYEVDDDPAFVFRGSDVNAGCAL
jgi:hypothetical protein